MPTARPSAQVDVFSATPYMGNPVPVVLDGTGLDVERMQRVARWTHLSETTFILLPAQSEADYQLRIFTPGGELPFAGHPTLGSARAWLEVGGTPKQDGVVVQECGAGLVQLRRGEVLSFAAPPTQRSGDLEDAYLADIVDAFGIKPEQVLSHQWVDNGPGWAVLRLATAQEVLDLEPDLSRIPTAMVSAIGAYPEGSEHAFEMRTFAPGVGVPEDPCLRQHERQRRPVADRQRRRSGRVQGSQGTKLGRAGQITITADADGTVWVGGGTTTRFRGTATV